MFSKQGLVYRDKIIPTLQSPFPGHDLSIGVAKPKPYLDASGTSAFILFEKKRKDVRKYEERQVMKI